MKKGNKDQPDATRLRHKVEEQSGKKPSLRKLPSHEADIPKILLELEVHQEELKIQNVELHGANDNTEHARKKIPCQPFVSPEQSKADLKFGQARAKTRRKVLIAEDNDFNYLMLREMLTRMDCSVIRAVNGKDAIEICSSDDSIDLVFMDIRMPIMDGYTAALQIKKVKPSLPLVAQTSLTSVQQIEDLNNPFDDYITKPLSPEILTEKLHKYRIID